jgi:hypothetical protein
MWLAGEDKIQFLDSPAENGPYQTCSVTVVKQFVEKRGMSFVTVLQVYYHMLSDTLPLFILFIAIRIILTIVIGIFIISQYCRLKGLIKINKSPF